MPGFLARESEQKQINVMDHQTTNQRLIPITFTADALIPISINKRQWNALMDTGSAVNCIGTQTLRDSKLSHLPIKTDNRQFKTADGAHITPVGYVILRLNIDKRTYTEKFYLFNNLSHPVGIPTSVWRRHDVGFGHADVGMPTLCRPYANVMPTLRCGVGLTSCWRRHADHDVFRPNADLMPTILIWAILNVIVLCYLMELGCYTVLSAYNHLRPHDFSVSDASAATSIGPVRDTEPTV